MAPEKSIGLFTFLMNYACRLSQPASGYTFLMEGGVDRRRDKASSKSRASNLSDLSEISFGSISSLKDISTAILVICLLRLGLTSHLNC